MSSTNITVFLQEYKQLETYAQAAGYNSVLDLEQTLQDQEKQDKLKLCRIVRNYISHHADGEVFAAVSDEMITFIRALSTSLIADKLKAGDRVTGLTPVKMDDTLSAATKKLLKSNMGWIPVVAPQMVYVGVLNTRMIMECIKQGVSVNTPLSDITKFETSAAAEAKAENIPVLSVNEPITNMKSAPAIVLNEKREKYRGVIV